MTIDRRLTRVFQQAKEVPFDDSAKFVLMSDCHRGDASWSDDFARNQNLYASALNHYYQKGFTYIELGDGDELWENRKFREIQIAHSHIFWKLRQFYREGRLVLIYGNHDMVKKSPEYVRENLGYQEDDRTGCLFPLFPEIDMNEGVVLIYQKTGQKLFLIHGHQGDLINDQLWKISRFLVRYICMHA